MGQFVWAIAAVAGLGQAQPASPDAAGMERLLGTWLLATYQTGDVTTLVTPWQKVTFSISNNQVVSRTVGVGGEYGVSAVTIDAGKSPKEMDLTTTGPGGERVVSKCIYQLDGETLRVVSSLRSGGDRPAAFDPKAALVVTLKRPKP